MRKDLITAPLCEIQFCIGLVDEHTSDVRDIPSQYQVVAAERDTDQVLGTNTGKDQVVDAKKGEARDADEQR